MAKREGGQPSPEPSEGWRRLHTAVGSGGADEVDLGQYVALHLRAGPDEAARAFPYVAAHLEGGCAACCRVADEVRTLLLTDPDR